MKSQVPFSFLGFLVFKSWMFCQASESPQFPAKWVRNLWVTGMEGAKRNQSTQWANIYPAPEAMGSRNWKGCPVIQEVLSFSEILWCQGPKNPIKFVREKDLLDRLCKISKDPRALWGRIVVRSPFFWRCFPHPSRDSLCWGTSSHRRTVVCLTQKFPLLHFPLPWFRHCFGLPQRPDSDFVGSEPTSPW